MSQQPGAQPGAPTGAAVRPTNGKATASLATGVTTLVLSWCCGFGLVGIVAVVLGVKARREIEDSGGYQQGDGLAVGGIVTGAAAAVIALLVLLVIGIAIAAGARLHTDSPSLVTSLVTGLVTGLVAGP